MGRSKNVQMKIALVVNSFPKASETFLFNLVIGLEEIGNDVTVISLNKSSDNHLFQSHKEKWSEKIKIRPNRLAKIIFFILYNIKKLYFFLVYYKKIQINSNFWTKFWFFCQIKDRFEIVHFAYSGIAVQFIDIIVNPTLNISWIVSCRGSAEIITPLHDPLRANRLKLLFESVNAIHCVSEHMASTILGYSNCSDKIFINYPSIDINFFKRNKTLSETLSKSKFKVITTGRMTFQKGYPFALLAIKNLIKKGIPVEYHIVGDGENLSMILYMIQELNIKNHVVLHGKISSYDVKKLLEESHVFLLPSLYEGVANAVLEAMALEIPVISTNSGGMGEVIKHQKNGLIVERFNPEEMAKELEWIWNNPQSAREIGVNGRITISKQLQLNHQIKIFQKNYQKCLYKNQ